MNTTQKTVLNAIISGLLFPIGILFMNMIFITDLCTLYFFNLIKMCNKNNLLNKVFYWEVKFFK